jgi:hypothetical protein
LVHKGRPDNPSLQTAWQVEIQSLLYVIGEQDLPLTWQRFMGQGAPSTPDESFKREMADFLQQLGRELNCGSTGRFCETPPALPARDFVRDFVRDRESGLRAGGGPGVVKSSPASRGAS